MSGAAMAVVLVLGAGMAGSGRVAAGQEADQQQPSTHLPIAPADRPDVAPPEIRARMDAERARMANDDRHKRLVQDAAKLVALSNELKADMDKTGKDELSMEVMRKAAEIEKLAHDVQNRMKN
jgi:hypothetical protein